MRWRILGKIRGQKLPERREEIISVLFKNRGLKTEAQKKAFLNPKPPEKLTPREVGLSLVQLKKAITRIKKAVKNREKIIVYGDYDTDGVCATAVVWEALDRLGAQVMPFIPTREEGYGLKVDRIDQMAKDGVGLIITVDQGIVHTRQVAHAKKAGVDVIVTDHHVPGAKKPAALAVVHSTQLAGVGVAWFLAREIGKSFSSGKTKLPVGENFSLDLAAIGTITDMMPLLGANRSIVKFGIEAVRKTKRAGLLALYDFAVLDKQKIGSYEIGFIIGPRLNAAGRMEDPMEALRLVCTRDENRAIGLAQGIDQKNKDRQDLLKQSALHARKLWLAKDGQSTLIFVQHPSYSEGVIGLIASKLVEEFYRPAVVVAQGEDWSKASARSVEEFNIIEAVRSCADLLGSHGGHPRAAGFSVKTQKLAKVKKRLIALAEAKLDKNSLKPTLKIETEIELQEVSFELQRRLEKFAPFGMKNRYPVFATRGVELIEAKTVGNENQHLKLEVRMPKDKTGMEVIGFGLGHLYPKLSPGQTIDIAYSLLVNEWNGRKRLQLKLRDIKFD